MRLNVVLGLALALLVGVNWLVKPDITKPNLEYLPEMVHSAAYKSFSPNPVFADGKTLQRPVAGTIARGQRPLPYKPGAEDAARAGEELRNPHDLKNEAALQRGAAVFTTFCQPCHGPAGTGNGLVALRGYPPPASLTADKAKKLKDGQIFHVITYGQANMPAHASQIAPEDRWKAVLYVRSLQQAAATTATAAAQATTGEPK